MQHVDKATSIGRQRRWADPTDDILAALNQIMFRASVAAGPVNAGAERLDDGVQLRQTVRAVERVTRATYSSWSPCPCS